MNDIQFQEGIISHYNYLFSFAFKLTHNKQDAEDVVQQVCFKAWKKRRLFTPGDDAEQSLKNWLSTITYNESITFLINRGKKHLMELRERPDIGGLSNLYVNEKGQIDYCDMQLSDKLIKTLELVHPMFLTPFLLSVLGELTYEEISKVLHINKGTIRSRISRAREYLREAFLFGTKRQSSPRRRPKLKED